MIQKWLELWCKWFGHKWDALDLVMFQMENESPFYAEVPEIRCVRCQIAIKAKVGVNRSLYE